VNDVRAGFDISRVSFGVILLSLFILIEKYDMFIL